MPIELNQTSQSFSEDTLSVAIHRVHNMIQNISELSNDKRAQNSDLFKHITTKNASKQPTVTVTCYYLFHNTAATSISSSFGAEPLNCPIDKVTELRQKMVRTYRSSIITVTDDTEYPRTVQQLLFLRNRIHMAQVRCFKAEIPVNITEEIDYILSLFKKYPNELNDAIAHLRHTQSYTGLASAMPRIGHEHGCNAPILVMKLRVALIKLLLKCFMDISQSKITIN